MELLRIQEQKRLSYRFERLLMELAIEGRLKNLPGKWGRFHGQYDYTFLSAFLSEGKKISPWNYEKLRYISEVGSCASRFRAEVIVDENKNLVHSQHIEGFFCGNKFCPVCATKKARADFSRLKWDIERQRDDYTFYTITLTLPSRKDGFRYEFDTFKKLLPNFLKKIGYGYGGVIAGVFGTYEVTYNEKHGWHPHCHLILAIPKDKISDNQVRYTMSGHIKSLTLERNGKDVEYSEFYIQDKFVDALHDCGRFLDRFNYNIVNGKREYINADVPYVYFGSCYDVNGSCSELTKYITKFQDIQTAEQLYVFIRDTYNLKKMIRIGIFRWDKEKERAFLDHMDEEYPPITQNKNSTCFYTGLASFIYDKYKKHYDMLICKGTKNYIIPLDDYHIIS